MGVTYFKRICNVLFLAEIQAMRKNPIIVTEEQVIIQIGLGRKSLYRLHKLIRLRFIKENFLKRERAS